VGCCTPNQDGMHYCTVMPPLPSVVIRQTVVTVLYCTVLYCTILYCTVLALSKGPLMQRTCHCTVRVTVLYASLSCTCHYTERAQCTVRVTVLHVSLYCTRHCPARVTVLYVSLYCTCHCYICDTVSAASARSRATCVLYCTVLYCTVLYSTALGISLYCHVSLCVQHPRDHAQRGCGRREDAMDEGSAVRTGAPPWSTWLPWTW